MQTRADGSIMIDARGMAIPVPDGSDPPSYVQWDAKYEAQHEAMRRAFRRIMQASSISPVLVDSERTTDNIPSGAALRRMAIPTVNRIRSIRGILTTGIKMTIAGQVELIAAGGEERFTVDPDKISIRWPPELSAGMGDEAEAITMLVQAGLLDAMGRVVALRVYLYVSAATASLVAGDLDLEGPQCRGEAVHPLAQHL